MNVLILCDSKFGNTMQLAEAMRAGLAPAHSVQVRSAADGVGPTVGVDLLLVGGPTHAHGASAPLKDALKAIPSGSLGAIRTATFDTRFKMNALLTGSAASTAGRLLKRAGADVVDRPQSFFVTRDDPPVLEPGELDRAVSWARTVTG